MSKTYTPRLDEIERRWFVVDATGQTLGRLASRVARVLEGKHKPEFASHIDTGDHVIVVNAARISVSRGKRESKVYVRHSGYAQGLKQETLGQLLARRPEEAVRRAVRGMLPKTRLGAQQLRKLKVYAGAEHPHEAQQPEPLDGSVGARAATARTTDMTATGNEADATPITTDERTQETTRE
jgi:large subunit ribosomal protein L13